MNASQRFDAVQQHKDIMTLRRMLAGLTSDLRDYRRAQESEIGNHISMVQDRYRDLKRQRRDRSTDLMTSPRNLIRREMDRIEQRLSKVCVKQKFTETIYVDNKKATTASYHARWKKSASSGVIFYVNILWYRHVGQKLYQTKEMPVSENYIILSATEYRTNVQHVRLYEVKAFSVGARKTVEGWVGQSKLGKQCWAFDRDRKLAINSALKLAASAVDKHLKGEA